MSVATLETTDIPSAETLDGITVFWRNWEPGRGDVTIVCYGSSWTAYFGAMSGRTIQQFVGDADTGYLVNKLSDYRLQKRTKQHESYLKRIVIAIKNHLEQGRAA